MEFIKRCWAEISVDALLKNLNRIQELTDNEARIMCVVKTNAYGHGDEATVPILEQNGITDFAVASVDEALHIRRISPCGNILILGGCLDDCFKAVIDNDIALSVYDFEYAQRLSRYALSRGKKAKIHIKLNTGMSRIGFDCLNESECQKTAADIARILLLSGIEPEGVFTHFAVSDEPDGGAYTAFQYANFERVKALVSAMGISIPLWHCCNGGAVINYPQYKMDMVRAGIVLYGIYNGFGGNDGFTPVLSLKTVITQIREIEAGTSVSYGRSFVSDKKLRTATVSIGYGDGYPRPMSNTGHMIVNGSYAPIIGRVCMDQTVIDVTGIECAMGDTVTVIGSENNISVTAADIAEIDNTINYDIVCRISKRVPRVYTQNGKPAQITEYI